MKVGSTLAFKEDYLYWSLIWELTSKYHYQFITSTENHKEIWLENDKNKEFPMIRVIRHDIDWANWLKRDLERTIQNGEQIRKKLYKKPIQLINIYVTKYGPVDDHDFIGLPVTYQKTKLQSFIVTSESILTSIQSLEKKMQIELGIQLPNEENIMEEQIQQLKENTIAASVKKIKEEQKVFFTGKPFFTYLFMIIQVVVFLLMELNGGSTNSATLIEFGAKFSPLILEGEWWRFITPILVHIGFIHLLMNTMSLYLIGAEVERIYGNTRFLFIYLFAGFSGTLASFIMNPNIAAGASGAIFGCFGALLYFGIVYPKLFFRTMGSSVIVLILINLIYGFSVPGIDNAGHIGGLIGGFFAAAVVSLPKQNLFIRQFVMLVVTVVVTYFSLQFGFSHHNSAAVNDETMAMLAQNYIKENEIEKASEMLKGYTKNHMDAPLSHFILGNITYENGDLVEAKNQYELAIQQNSQLHEAYYNLALVYLELNKADEAKKLIKKAIELNPSEESYQKLYKELEAAEKSVL